jgi:hypothetical protein
MVTSSKKALINEVVEMVTNQQRFADQPHLLEIMTELPNVNQRAARGIWTLWR